MFGTSIASRRRDQPRPLFQRQSSLNPRRMYSCVSLDTHCAAVAGCVSADRGLAADQATDSVDPNPRGGARRWQSQFRSGSAPLARALPGNLVLFGPGMGDHVALIVRMGTDPRLASHGDDLGPRLVNLNAEAPAYIPPTRFMRVPGV